mgnify:CR=1 FL=1
MAREFIAVLQTEVGSLYLRLLESVAKIEALTEENAALKAAAEKAVAKRAVAKKDAKPE